MGKNTKKILLLSDIHGNYPALAAVAAQAKPSSCSMILNCGDATVYAPFANETLDWLQRHGAISILGNTDLKVRRLLRGKNFKKPRKPEKRIMYTDTAKQLSKASRDYLQQLKKKKKLKVRGWTIGLFHGSPNHRNEFLFADTPDARFQELAEDTDCDIIITGHSHTPYYKKICGVHFINPGSVGRMFDGNPDASYALLSLDRNSVAVRHFRCSYAIEQVVAALEERGLPSIYADMYRVGKKLN